MNNQYETFVVKVRQDDEALLSLIGSTPDMVKVDSQEEGVEVYNVRVLKSSNTYDQYAKIGENISFSNINDERLILSVEQFLQKEHGAVAHAFIEWKKSLQEQNIDVNFRELTMMISLYKNDSKNLDRLDLVNSSITKEHVQDLTQKIDTLSTVKNNIRQIHQASKEKHVLNERFYKMS